MDKKILPLGTVVILKEGDGTQLMIISRATVVEDRGKEVYFDYGAVLIPQGMISPEAVYFFNRENIEKIIFKGFENAEEQQFAENYDFMLEKANVEKGSVEWFSQKKFIFNKEGYYEI